MWRTFSTAHGGCFPLHGDPGPAFPATHHHGTREESLSTRPTLGSVTVPDLVGMSSQDARRTARLSELGLFLEEKPADSGLRGRVIRQDPEPGTLARPGDVIDAQVGGRPGVAVPDVRGADEQDALVSLRTAGLTPTRRVVRRSSSVAPGLVIRTRPRAGTEVPVGTRVSYVIASAARERASAKRAARRSRVRWIPDGAFLSMPDRE